MRGGVIEKDAVSLLLMLSQSLAVVSGDDDNGVVIPSVLLEIGNEVPEHGVRVGDLAVVQAVFVLVVERSRRLVGIMRIVEMHPDEVRPGGMSVQPLLSMLGDLGSPALYASPSFLSLRVLGKVVVEVESAIKAGRQAIAIEDNGADKGGGVVPLALQQLGPCGVVGPK